MLLKKFKPTTPSRRYFTSIVFIDNTKAKLSWMYKRPQNVNNFNNLQGYRLSTSLRKIRKIPQVALTQELPRDTVFVLKNFVYDTLFFKEYASFQSILGFSIILPATNSMFPGMLFFSRVLLSEELIPEVVLNTITSLNSLAFNLHICYIKNSSNNKWTYGLGHGTQCTKRQASKKFKLTLVELPSTQTTYLPGSVYCIAGTLPEGVRTNLVYGKYGSYLLRKKKTRVRGVAMNPVDHPNGGRTKSAQPELSPWGWVAKHSH